MKTKLQTIIIISMLFAFTMNSQTEFKKDSLYQYSWNNSIADWYHNTIEHFSFENGGNKETNQLRLNLSGINWQNFYQFNKTYNAANNLTSNIQQNWNDPISGWNDKAKYDYTYDTSENETEYLYSFYSTSISDWQPYQRHLKTYNANLIEELVTQQYDFTAMDFINEDQTLYTYLNGILQYETHKMWFNDVAVWQEEKLLEYIYFPSGLLKEIQHYAFNTSTGTFNTQANTLVKYAYDSTNKISEITTQLWINDDWLNYERFVYNYLNDNPIEQRIETWSTTESDWIYSTRQLRAFDAYDNEIELIYQSWNTSTDLWTGIVKIVSFWSPVETLGVVDLETFENHMDVYPNPTSDFIIINSNTILDAVELLDLNGKSVLKEHNQTYIKVNHLASGMYILKLHSENKSITKRIIIK